MASNYVYFTIRSVLILWSIITSNCVTLKNEYFFLVDWLPAAPISDDWLGKDGVLPAEIVFLSQEEADEAGEPNGETHEEDAENIMCFWNWTQ